jgi:exodeoxyribonuclease-3
MRIISFNVNGIRALLKKDDFSEMIEKHNPDVICLQETKLQKDMTVPLPDGYEPFYNCAERKGYSGTLTMTKVKPINTFYENYLPEEENEGRVIVSEFEDYFLINEYTPNYGRELETNTRGNHLPERVGFRMQWEDARRKRVLELDKIKPVILCGDLNVAHEEIDLKNPSSNHKNAGFTDEEREKMTEFLNAGFVDIFRKTYPEKVQYSWWSYRFNARANNSGWRIDYFICSERFFDKVKKIDILNDVFGSDHCPVLLEI